MNERAIIALLKRLRSQIGRGEHRSALWETLDLVDVACEAPSNNLSPTAPSDAEQTLPAPPAVEAAKPADATEGGGGAACSKGGWTLFTALEKALAMREEDRIDDNALGLELLRIANALHTESKRLRATHPDGSPRSGCEVCSAQPAALSTPELDARERGMR